MRIAIKRPALAGENREDDDAARPKTKTYGGRGRPEVPREDAIDDAGDVVLELVTRGLGMIPAESATAELAAWARARLEVLDTTGKLAAAVDELERRAAVGELKVKRLDLRPGDVLVVECEAPLDAEETFGGRHRALILGDRAQLAVAGEAIEAVTTLGEEVDAG